MGVVIVLGVIFVGITLGACIDAGDSWADRLGVLVCVLGLWAGLGFACYLASATSDAPAQDHGQWSGP